MNIPKMPDGPPPGSSIEFKVSDALAVLGWTSLALGLLSFIVLVALMISKVSQGEEIQGAAGAVVGAIVASVFSTLLIAGPTVLYLGTAILAVLAVPGLTYRILRNRRRPPVPTPSSPTLYELTKIPPVLEKYEDRQWWEDNVTKPVIDMDWKKPS